MKRIIRACKNSYDGICSAYKSEAAFREEVWLLVVAILVVLNLEVTLVHKALLIGSVVVIMIVELLNSAIEAAIDRISLDIHPLSKKAKDIGSAAVFVAFINAIIIWVCVLCS